MKSCQSEPRVQAINHEATQLLLCSHWTPHPRPHPSLQTLSTEPLLFPAEVSSPSTLKSFIQRHQSQAYSPVCQEPLLPGEPPADSQSGFPPPSSGDASDLPPPTTPALSAFCLPPALLRAHLPPAPPSPPPCAVHPPAMSRIPTLSQQSHH